MSEDKNRSSYWWKGAKADADNIHDRVQAHASYLQEIQARASWIDLTLEALYENEPLSGGREFSALQHLGRQGFQSAKLNVTRSVIDTLVAKIGRRPPAVKASPDDANYSLRKRAKQCTRFIAAEQERTNMHILQPMQLRDACVVGTGCIKVYPRFGKIAAEIVPKEELFVDPRDARYGNPRQLHQKKRVPIEVLVEMFPDKKDQIYALPEPAAESDHYSEDEVNSKSDMTDVWESWHLPSGPNAKDGVHAMWAPGITLSCGPWERERYPISFLHYARRRRGFWGKSLAELGAELQYKIDDVLRDILSNLYYGSQLMVVGKKGSYDKNHFGRQQGPFAVEWTGSHPPVVTTPDSVSNDQVQMLQFLIDQYYHLAGISQADAGVQNPLGADASGAALEELYDQKTERYQITETAYSQSSVDCAELFLDCARQIHQDGENKYVAKWSDRGTMHSIPWGKAEMKADEYQLTLEPTGFLPDTRAGKISAIERLSDTGLFQGPQLARLLMDEPDLASVSREINSPEKNLQRIMEELADEEKPFPGIDPNWNIDRALELGKAYYNDAQAEGAPETVLKRYRDFNNLMIAGQQKVQEGTPAEPMPPDMGMPMEGGDAQLAQPDLASPLPPAPAPETLEGAALPGVTIQ